MLDGSGAVKSNIPKAEAVTFDEGAAERAEAVKQTGCLGASDVDEIRTLEEEAKDDGVQLLVRLGDTQTFAVRHKGDRSIPACWAHVHTRDIALPAESQPSRSAARRSTFVANLQCKVSQG